MKRIITTILTLTLGFTAVHAEPSKPAKDKAPAEEAKPAVEAPALDPEEAIKKLDLPGIKINAKERYIDVDSEVCLDSGALEVVATTPDSKEHEAIIKVLAEPVHIHMALLLIGAKAGNPATQRPIGEGEEKRWVFIPARGHPIGVSFVIKDEKGESIERPVADFITRIQDESEFIGGEQEEPKDLKFPTSTFLFLGSHLIENGDGPRRYIAAESGNVITISTFGDEMLGLSEMFGHENGALVWEINTDLLPKLGTKVTLRLRPVFKP